MGQALYRKYRSKSLKEIIGQEHITDTLSSAIQSGRISHAYLFTGPKGVGKTSIARILAHEINSLPYDDEQAHIDIIEIDAASNRRIDEIRELRDKIHVAPALAKYKVYIIDEVHMLTREAFNALLKTLEEPPEHAVFILATTEAHKLPETIVSRTQRYTFKPIAETIAIRHLKSIAQQEKIQITDDALQLIAEHGDGSFRDSISLLDQLGAAGKDIELDSVQKMLGIAPVSAIQSLLESVRAGNDSNQAFKGLAALFDQGYPPASVAKQLAIALRTELAAASSVLANDVALLSALLEVPLSHDPETRLEVALLAYSVVAVAQPQVQTSQQPRQAVKPKVEQPVSPVPENKAEVSVAEPVETSVEERVEPVDAQASPAVMSEHSAQLDPDTWQEVLNRLKKQHNTLYGIVRMAQPDFSTPGALHLAFGFAFHQKRANEAKNRQIIGDTIAVVTGGSVEISCTYDSDAKVAQPVLGPARETEPTEQSPLTTISNIFGGVEMVE